MEMYIFCCFFIFIFSLSLSCLQKGVGGTETCGLGVDVFFVFYSTRQGSSLDCMANLTRHMKG
jgi:hypothetical protein